MKRQILRCKHCGARTVRVARPRLVLDNAPEADIYYCPICKEKTLMIHAKEKDDDDEL